MPKPRSPNRDKAKEMYLNSKGNKPLKEIAAEVGVSDTQIRKWKSTDNWDGKTVTNGNVTKRKGTANSNANSNVTKQGENMPTLNVSKKEGNADTSKPVENSNSKTNSKPKSRGAPSGNKNAIGNRGGNGAPPDNKYAVVTHEFEKILFSDDMLNESEKALLDAHYDKFEQHLVLLKTLRIQEHRALSDIKDLRANPSGMAVESVTKVKGTLNIESKYKSRSGDERPGDSSTEATDNTSLVAVPAQLRIMRLEDALIRIRGKIQKAVEVWHKMEMDAERLGIERQRMEIYRQKLAGQYDIEGLLEGDDLGLERDVEQGGPV